MLSKVKRGIWKFSPEHLKVSKLKLWWDSFVQSRKCMSLKFTGELFVITSKKDAKLEEESTYHFKIDMRILMNFDPSTRKSKTFTLLMGCLWPKSIMFELKKLQRGCAWWNWILMLNWKENWVVVSKMTWGISEIFTRVLESLQIGTLMRFFYLKKKI